jgi:poly-beta-hydroxybutyrate-responsive repressor
MADRANGRNSRDREAGGTAPPRSWLTPYLLMLLRSWNAYGYELVRQLALFGFSSVDPGSVYRALRELEQEGKVTSHWDTSATSGPARRVYTITDAGIEALRLQAAMLESYREMLERFFSLYTGGGSSTGGGSDAGAPAGGAAEEIPSSQRP